MLSLFATINLAYIQEINVLERDYSNLRQLKMSNGTRKEYLKVVRNEHQHTKTIEDKEVF